MPNGEFFLNRLKKSLHEQTYQDWELVITKEGKMAENTNAAIRQADGEIIKVLYMDDYFAHDHALQDIVDAFEGKWLVTGCLHDDGQVVGEPHVPLWNSQIHLNNTIGSPSVLTIENKEPLMFDERMSWTLDADYYKRLHERYGEPTILPSMNVVIGVGEHQMSHILTDPQKQKEQRMIQKKHG